jgi:hypothetical protein
MSLADVDQNVAREMWKDLGVRTTFAVMKAVHAKYPHVKFLLAEPSHRAEIASFIEQFRQEDSELSKKLIIGLNLYPVTDAPHSMDPVSYFVPVIRDIQKRFPDNQVIFSETSSVGEWGLPDRMTWFNAMLKVQQKTHIETMIWYPAINYGAWHDENILVEHGAWHHDSERTPFEPLIHAVKEVNGVVKKQRTINSKSKSKVRIKTKAVSSAAELISSE